MTPGMLVAVAAAVTALIAGLGWWRETRKDHTDTRRSDLDIVLSGYQQLLKDGDSLRSSTKKEVAAALSRALDCEEREEALKDRIDLLEAEVRRMGGHV